MPVRADLAASQRGVVTLAPLAVERASKFVDASLRSGVSREEWLAGLADGATPALLNSLRESEHDALPAHRRTVRPQVSTEPTYISAIVSVDTGTRRLRGSDQGLLVDSLDWRSATQP